MKRLCHLVVITAIAAAMGAQPAAEKGATLGNIKPGAELAPGWTVKSVTPTAAEVRIEAVNAEGKNVIFHLRESADKPDAKSPFEAGGLFLYYAETKDVPPNDILAVGKALAKIVSDSAKDPAGLKAELRKIEASAESLNRVEARKSDQAKKKKPTAEDQQAANALLHSLTGRWKVVVNGGGSGTIERKELGPNVIEEDGEGTMPGDPAPLRTRSFYGFNPEDGQYWYFSTNSMHGGFWSGTGTWDAAKRTLTFDRMPVAPAGSSSKVVLRFTGDRKHVLEIRRVGDESKGAAQTLTFEPAE